MRILNSYMVVRMKSMNRMKAIRRITTLVMLFIIIFCFAVTGFDMNVIINRCTIPNVINILGENFR